VLFHRLTGAYAEAWNTLDKKLLTIILIRFSMATSTLSLRGCTMYVCLCHSVTDTDIRRLVRTEGVCTMRELSQQLGVATQCGKCGRCAKEVLREAVHEARNEADCCGLVAA
jgi:bacterioferritin-associated ferredoxin